MTAPARSGRDAGFTLIELLVYIVLLAVVLGTVTTILVGAIRNQARTQTLGAAVSTGQVVARSVSRGIADASGFAVSSATAAGQLLQARVANTSAAGSTTWTCRAWYYSAASGAVYAYSSSSAAGLVPTVSVDGSVATAGWSLLGTGFGLSGASPAFAASSGQLTLTLTVSTGGTTANRVLVTTTVAPMTQTDTTTGPTTCS